MIHCYKLGGYNIVLDTASGSIHSVDNAAYDAINMYETEGAEKTAAKLKEKYAEDITDNEICELISDIEELKRAGKLFSSEEFIAEAAVRLKNAETQIKALCLNVSHECNMVCGYCFAGKGEYGGGGLMAQETGRRAVDFLVENSGLRKNLDIDFFGGEPLLNWEMVKQTVRYAREIEETSGKRFRFTLTTNGLLIDDDVINFTTREMQNVVLSLDGRPEVHDRHRKTYGGGGTYDEIIPKFKKLVKARGGKGYYIRGTFTRDNLDFVNDVLHMAELGFGELSMEPAVGSLENTYAPRKEDLPVLERQYELLAEEMIRRNREGRGFAFYHYNIDLTGGPCVYKRIAGCGSGTEYLAVTPQGELYPCHQFVGDAEFLMGDIWRGVTNRDLCVEFKNRNMISNPECGGCWAKMYCSGGCAANACNTVGSIHGVHELGCALFKKRIECAVMMKVASSFS